MGYLIAAALILILMPAVILSHMARTRLAESQRQLRAAIEHAEHAHAALVAHSALEQNLEFLRASLDALGRPRRVGDKLFFGATLINGDTSLVDQVNRQCGGAAAIFLGETPVATSVPDSVPDAGHSPSPLAPPTVLARVLGGGVSHYGELQIGDQPYLTVHAPILADSEVIGMIFTGVRGPAPLPGQAASDHQPVSVTALKAVLQAQADTLHRGLVARQTARDGMQRAYEQAA